MFKKYGINIEKKWNESIDTTTSTFAMHFLSLKVKETNIEKKGNESIVPMCFAFLDIYIIYSHLICKIKGIYATIAKQGPNIAVVTIFLTPLFGVCACS